MAADGPFRESCVPDNVTVSVGGSWRADAAEGGMAVAERGRSDSFEAGSVVMEAVQHSSEAADDGAGRGWSVGGW